MKNSEILQRYKLEVKSEKFQEIHENYRRESSQLYSKYEVKNHLSIPLLIIAIITVICCIFSLVKDNAVAFYMLLATLVVVLIVRKLNKIVVENRDDKAHSIGSLYSKELVELRYNYLSQYNSVVGLFEAINDCCCDYDDNSEQYYCCVTGRKLNYPEYISCQKKYAFNSCDCSKMYYKDVYED